MTVCTENGDAEFGDSIRNPGKLVGNNPYATETIEEKYQMITEQRKCIIESFLAEHAGLLPSQVVQVTRALPNGDIAWHLEART